jgi:murein DD-endopeptidase MepM/ murein hydrolase activator NlpD
MSSAPSPRETTPQINRLAAFTASVGIVAGLGLPVVTEWDEASLAATDAAEAPYVPGDSATEVDEDQTSPHDAALAVIQAGTFGAHPLQNALNSAHADAEVKAAETWHVPVATYYISSPFGEPRYSGPHIGLDFAGNNGVPVVAARHGVVTQAGWEGGYGFAVTLDHGDGHTTKYAHLAYQPIVAVGEQVKGGQEIGNVGNTGDSTGPHLHFELLSYGQPIDPYLVISIPPRQGPEAS